QILDQAALSIVAYIILVIGDNSTSLKYLGYLANSLKTKYKDPHIVAVYRPANIKKIPLDFIRYSLNLDENDQIIDVDVDDPASVKYLLNQLIPTKSLKMRSLS